MIQHLETIKLVPLPDSQPTVDDHLDIELMRDSSVLIIFRNQNISVQINKEETEKLIAALQHGLKTIHT